MTHMSSGSVHIRAESGSNGFNDDCGEEEEEEAEISATDGEKEQRKRGIFGRCTVGVRKGKKRFLFRFRKLRGLFKSPHSTSSSSSPNSTRRFGGGLCCFPCLSKPQVVESDATQGNVDPDDPERFSYEYLKSMIEKNDFYSKECDTHFDF